MNANRNNSSRKNSSQRSGILSLIGLAALAWIKLDRGAETLVTDTHEFGCGALSRCAANLKLTYPLGDGLVFAPIIDEFF
jgi:hypothetical protein